ncbi:hypothetical protein [Dolichospermum sp. UHCC 0259]|uniref:hypothetical protein n=1 Tax=Dolichospermum sp. UHCC 0259 TaxID=2590010 RepID=UPI001445BD8C|nr:hypothetical protein [Dolichospermum sp. UHCC 0259]MTJ48849.1 hypothetical protein [Dolichospermum sp. UHCC 0259]
MNRSQIVAIVTGVFSILLAIAYLIVVQIIDYRDMKPAPISQVSPPVIIAENNLLDLHLDIIAKV